MRQENIKLASEMDGLMLDIILTIPEQKPKGIIQLAHGMAEHKERYMPFMEFMSKNGYIVCINDHRGHGQSVRKADDLGFFYDKSGEFIVEDIKQITLYLRKRFPELPLTLFGHSMGSLVVRAYTRKYDDLIDKLVVCGSPSANPASGVAVALINTMALFKGERYISPMMVNLSTGGYNKGFESEGENAWLSVNKENVEKYNADRLCGFPFKLNGYRCLMKLMNNAYAKKGWVLKNPSLPVMFISGSEDPCAVNKDQWLSAIEDMKSHGYSDVSGKMYEGYRHEILNEDCKEEVCNDVLEFISR